MIPIVGIGAGLVAALLFSVVITGSPLSALLYSAAPLPIFIASLGWNHRSGLFATAAGALAVAVALAPTGGIAFALIIGLPAWWIAYLALLARTDAQGAVEWYPLGNLMVWIAATAALATFGMPTAAVSWITWRCRLESDTSSSSIMPIVPTPAAARYWMSGVPRPPAPTTSTRARFSFCCPGPPTSARTMWRA